MNLKYQKWANIAAGVWLISIFVLLGVTGTGQIKGNIWDEVDLLGIAVFLTYAISLMIALWFYAKAKGYSGVLAILLFFLSVLGLIILLVLPDKLKDEQANET